MSNEAKLRTLLAEARRELARHVFTQESPACVNCGGESGFDVGRACPYAADYDLKQRIKAALAEPVGDDFKRGAEAMREAAAAHINANIVGDQTAMILAARIYEKEIRALPIPEDKR